MTTHLNDGCDDRRSCDLHLLPKAWKGLNVSTLKEVYHRAFEMAQELYIVSAFLTEWPSGLELNQHCKAFLLVVGADFGTTRRVALEDALRWLPSRFRGSVLAFNQKGVNFHPKAVLWREHDGSCHFLIGSSNLTRAAFDRNVEANVTLRLEPEEFEQALGWFFEIESRSVEVNKSWLDRYEEAPVRGGSLPAEEQSGDDEPDAEELPVFDLALDIEGEQTCRDFDEQLLLRRAQREEFDATSRVALLTLFRRSARKATWSDDDNADFYDELVRLWSKDHSTRMGGIQWVIQGKHTDHQEFSKSFVTIVDASKSERDAVVMREKDRLSERGISTRSAVMTELLCHFFPTRYPILDDPVRRWRSAVGFDRREGGTEGERYIRLARAMRTALNDSGPQRLGVRDLAELDVLIWFKFRR